MKRIWIMLVVALMLTMPLAGAEEVIVPEIGVITRIENGAMIDLNEDGIAEQITYDVLVDREGYDIGYRLKVGNARIVRDGWAMDENIYVLKLSQYSEPLLLVCDYGPSDDYMTSFHAYSGKELSYAGMIPSLAEQMRVRDGIITTSIRGNVLHTWYHDADFGLARSNGIEYANEDWDFEDWYSSITLSMYQIPRDLYPMGVIVTLKADLPLVESRIDSTERTVLPQGSKAILCATDDEKWVYIQSLDDQSMNGWMEVVGEFGIECRVGNQTMYSDELFQGLLFAD